MKNKQRGTMQKSSKKSSIDIRRKVGSKVVCRKLEAGDKSKQKTRQNVIRKSAHIYK